MNSNFSEITTGNFQGKPSDLLSFNRWRKMGEKVQFSDVIWTNNDRRKNVFWALKWIVLFKNYIGKNKKKDSFARSLKSNNGLIIYPRVPENLCEAPATLVTPHPLCLNNPTSEMRMNSLVAASLPDLTDCSWSSLRPQMQEVEWGAELLIILKPLDVHINQSVKLILSNLTKEDRAFTVGNALKFTRLAWQIYCMLLACWLFVCLTEFLLLFLLIVRTTSSGFKQMLTQSCCDISKLNVWYHRLLGNTDIGTKCYLRSNLIATEWDYEDTAWPRKCI